MFRLRNILGRRGPLAFSRPSSCPMCNDTGMARVVPAERQGKDDYAEQTCTCRYLAGEKR